MWRDDATLLDILRAAHLALEFRGGLNKAAFLTDFKTQAAILHELLVIGEGVKRLSTAFREEHPGRPSPECGTVFSTATTTWISISSGRQWTRTFPRWRSVWKG